MVYLLSYLLVCWMTVVVNVLQSAFGGFPYRFDATEGYDRCRPGTYKEYVEFLEGNKL